MEMFASDEVRGRAPPKAPNRRVPAGLHLRPRPRGPPGSTPRQPGASRASPPVHWAFVLRSGGRDPQSLPAPKSPLSPPARLRGGRARASPKEEWVWVPPERSGTAQAGGGAGLGLTEAWLGRARGFGWAPLRGLVPPPRPGGSGAGRPSPPPLLAPGWVTEGGGGSGRGAVLRQEWRPPCLWAAAPPLGGLGEGRAGAAASVWRSSPSHRRAAASRPPSRPWRSAPAEVDHPEQPRSAGRLRRRERREQRRWLRQPLVAAADRTAPRAGNPETEPLPPTPPGLQGAPTRKLIPRAPGRCEAGPQGRGSCSRRPEAPARGQLRGVGRSGFLSPEVVPRRRGRRGRGRGCGGGDCRLPSPDGQAWPARLR
ncbi:translation initiation factor IF-2-like [Trichosurus vulpecula]|uniref:translation initiation factor IF-2-like n=1 Tax=Trichosurus vulpecula TaxID=9337 RepID=UPI00186ACB83|nr:translation initiation factor IF-2-like [Trichosurus vulpecula]